MAFCHGKGNEASDGCCYINGQICPLRWKIVAGRIYVGPNLTDIGTVEAFAKSITNNKNAQQRIIDQATNITYACEAAIEILIQDYSLINDRAAFEAAWTAHPDYVALVRPYWATIEQNLGLPANTYNCSSWTGVFNAECCYAEDAATNTSKSSTLTSSAVSIRSQRSR